MDIGPLIQQVGLWPALAMVAMWLLYKVQEARIAEKNERITRMEEDARKTMAAKDLEREEWKRLALEDRPGRRSPR